MVGTQTNLDGGFGISKKSSFSDKEAVPQKNLLTSSRLLSSLCLLCCNDLRQFDFTCVCLSKYTACWAGQLPSDAWDCFMTEDGKISMVFISPSKPCPQMVLHVWDRTGSLHCSSSSSSATTNTRFYLSTQWHPYGDALTQHLPALQIVFLGFSPVLHFWIGRRKPRSPSGYPSQDPMTHLTAKRPVGKKYLNNSNDCFLSSQGLLARCCAHLSRALLEGLHLYPWLCTTLAKITLFRIRLKSHHRGWLSIDINRLNEEDLNSEPQRITLQIYNYWRTFGSPLHSSGPYFDYKHVKWDGILRPVNPC